MTPFFSVIIPTYNRAALMQPTLESVWAQTFTDYELIVVDDGSTDDTWAYLQSLGSRIRAIRQENAGPGTARNTAVASARGQYCAFLDSDDLWFPYTLANYVRAINDFSSPAMVGGYVQFFSGDPPTADASTPWRATRYDDLLSYDGIITRTMVTSCAAVRTDALRATDGFMKPNYIYDEYHLWMQLGTAAGFVYIDSPLSVAQRSHEVRINRSRSRGIAGATYMINQEKAGRYPGGDARAKQRRRLLASWVRDSASAFAVRGHVASAMYLYLRTLSWQWKDGQQHFVVRLPLTACKGLLRRCFGQTSRDLTD